MTVHRPFTDYHAAFWAASLTATQAGGSVAGLTRSIANARVDLNPHQVDAALFALRSPLARGVILADEVGLGKTIEAGLVLAQRWAERRRRLLLIAPASLRTQWIAELQSKFALPARMLDGKDSSFAQHDAVLVVSYQFAARHADAIAAEPWDLVVFDEAHRLRNVYRSSSRMAATLREATSHATKLLLTATPLQNTLIELFELASFVDPHRFGDEASFRARFGGGSSATAETTEALRERLHGLVTRTLRSQVREYVRFTNRIPITQDFAPSAAEQELYELVSAYLQRDDLIAIPRSQRALLTLVLRRLLASSSFAIAETLRKLIDRLQGEGQTTDASLALARDFETLEDMADEFVSDDEPDTTASVSGEAQSVSSEIEELKRYLRLAEGISRNAKGEALVAALDTAFAQTARLGGPRKAVVFTESRRTQRYLVQLLSERGWAGQVVAIDGQNTDPDSRAILERWRERHAGDSVVTGSRAADTRSAIVETFRDDASILVATEAAAEGVNLQFCSLVVNYDLPWNPQRVEQRIGRCHRYGQQFDVVVLNLVNSTNAADRRVFELLSSKFRLFEGVFGVSDGVLGALAGGVDIERRIADVYQRCRTIEEIESAFDALQAELDDEIADRMASTRRAVLEHFDEDVHARLQVHRDQAQSALLDHQRTLWRLAQHELAGLASFSEREPRFVYHGPDARGGGYHLHWPEAERRGDVFFRSDDPLASWCIHRAATRRLPVARVDIGLSQHPTPIAALSALAGRRGWLVCGELMVQALEQERYVVCASVTDGDVSLDREQIERLLGVSACTSDLGAAEPPAALARERESAVQGILREVEVRSAAWYDEEVAKLEHWADDLRLSLERQLRDLDMQISEARRGARAAETMAAKLEMQRTLKTLEQRRNDSRRALFDAQDQIGAKRDMLIADVERQLSVSTTWEERFVIEWRCL